jgi:hypothetical protein
MPDPGPATDPAVPEDQAPPVVTIPAPPAPVVDTPRPPEEIPVNEGAGPETPVEGTVDEVFVKFAVVVLVRKQFRQQSLPLQPHLHPPLKIPRQQ